VLAALFGVSVAHELVHGLFFRVFGGHPRYGAGRRHFLPYLYATSPGTEYTLRQILIIALAPLLVLSPLALAVALLAPALVGYAGLAFMGNTGGAVGDLWMAGRLLRFRGLHDVTVVDLRDGMAVYAEDPKAAEIAEKLSSRDRQRPVFVVFLAWWLGAALAVFVTAFAVWIVASLLDISLLIGPPQFPIVENVTLASGEVVGGPNLAAALLAGLLFALAMLLLSRREERARLSA
jgi:hypothetical protein